MIRLDESHATHISCKVENPVAALRCLVAVLVCPQIEQQKLIAEFFWLHELVFSPVDTPNPVALLAEEDAHV